MNKKTLILLIVLVVAAVGAGLYFLVFRDSGEEEVQLYSFVPGDYFVTNVKDSDRLFKVTVVIMLNTDKLEEKLTEDEHIIRDTIIFELRALTEEDIESEDIQDRIREKITASLNSVLGIDNVVTVYFNDFVMQ